MDEHPLAGHRGNALAGYHLSLVAQNEARSATANTVGVEGSCRSSFAYASDDDAGNAISLELAKNATTNTVPLALARNYLDGRTTPYRGSNSVLGDFGKKQKEAACYTRPWIGRHIDHVFGFPHCA